MGCRNPNKQAQARLCYGCAAPRCATQSGNSSAAPVAPHTSMHTHMHTQTILYHPSPPLPPSISLSLPSATPPHHPPLLPRPTMLCSNTRSASPAFIVTASSHTRPAWLALVGAGWKERSAASAGGRGVGPLPVLPPPMGAVSGRKGEEAGATLRC